MHNGFLAELARLGPDAPPRPFSLAAARSYCARLTRTHYENFSVASLLLPRRLLPHFHAVYGYCRWADDLADEAGGGAKALALLGWWRKELLHCYLRGCDGQPCHPVMTALRATIRRFAIPPRPFLDLLTAFEQDQAVKRYRTFEELRGYCRYSANPVGRLVLYLCGYSDAERQRLSDATCTALQLANFWQDVTVDLLKDRIYIPLDILERRNAALEDLFAHRFTPGFREAMREIVGKARELFLEGLPLVGMVDRRLALDLDLFSRGGMRVLKKIEEQGYDVLSARPAISKIERFRLLLASLLRLAVRRAT